MNIFKLPLPNPGTAKRFLCLPNGDMTRLLDGVSTPTLKSLMSGDVLDAETESHMLDEIRYRNLGTRFC